MNAEDATGESRGERFVTHVDLTEPINVSTLTLTIKISGQERATCAANESESVANLFDYEKFIVNLVFIHFRYRLIRQRMQHSKQL
jgi:hypothetical protein